MSAIPTYIVRDCRMPSPTNWVVASVLRNHRGQALTDGATQIQNSAPDEQVHCHVLIIPQKGNGMERSRSW